MIMRKLFLILLTLILCAGAASVSRPNVRSNEIVLVDGQNYYLHTVVKGETMYSLSKLYGVTSERIVFDNPFLSDGLKTDQIIKILCEDIPEMRMSPRKQARTFSEHVVAHGETTYSISRRYSLSINVLIQDNPGLDPAKLALGQVLRIRKSEIGETSPTQLQREIGDYAEMLNSVSEGYVYHLVEMGETIYSLSRRMGVTEEDILNSNDLSDGLRAGAIIKIPVKNKVYPGMKQVTTLPVIPEPAESYVPDLNAEFKPRYIYGGINIALLLPLTGHNVSEGNRSNFIEFYQGCLIAMEDLKNEGHIVRADLFDTQRSIEKTSDIMRQPAFVDSDLIIGPVYEECLQPVMEFARSRSVPVVSPLGIVNGSYGRGLYQLSPSPGDRYEKLQPMFSENKNIVFITTDNNDWEFERDMTALAGGIPIQRIIYSKATPPEHLDSLLISRTTENMFVVLANDEASVELILAALSSVQNNRLARSIRTAPIRVVGSSKWVRYNSLDKGLMFKLNVSYVTNYHADRNNVSVYDFDRRYLSSFGTLPSLYSYRGYDAVKLFAEALVRPSDDDFSERLNSLEPPLQTPYVFRPNGAGNNYNSQWALVRYRSNYSVTVE